MHLRCEATVCAVMSHGEHGVIARLMTGDGGLVAGYVRGGRSRRLRPILIPGNRVMADFRSRSDEQMPGLSVELVRSRAMLMTEPLAASAIDWACLLTARALPEGQAYPAVASVLDAVLDAVASAPSARGWAAGMVGFELTILQALGFGLALDQCVVTNAVTGLAFVSPKSGGAVSVAAAISHEHKLLRLPPFLIGGGTPSWPELMDGLTLSGHFIARRLFDGARNDPMLVRQRMIDRLRRAAT